MQASRLRGVFVAIGALGALGAFASRAVAERAVSAVAVAAAGGLADAGEALESPPEMEGPSVDELIALGGASPIEIPRGIVERVSVAAPTGPNVPRRRAPAAATLGILVRASVVRAAIARGGRPSGSPVAPSGARPAGLVLSGISAYGSALRDGDILTRVGGTPATSASRVIGAVTGAVRSGAKAIDGEVWRDGRRIPVVVELPRFAKPKRAG